MQESRVTLNIPSRADPGIYDTSSSSGRPSMHSPSIGDVKPSNLSPVLGGDLDGTSAWRTPVAVHGRALTGRAALKIFAA